MVPVSKKYIPHNTMFKLIVLICIWLMSISPQVSANPDISSLITEIEQARKDLGIPALALTIVTPNDTLWSGTMGTADLKSGKDATSKTMFRIGSITKMFTATAILLLQQDGLIRLDDIATDVVPNMPYKNKWRKKYPVRIAHLLEHTAGLLDLSGEEFNHPRPMKLDDALKWNAESRRIMWPAGRHSSYTNVGPGLAAYVLEKVTQQSYEDFVTERIFKPLGMHSASFYPDDNTMEYLATGYDRDGRTEIPYWHMLYRAFGAINIRPAEMAPFIQLLLNKGLYKGKRLLLEKSVERMETPMTSLAARNGLTYGYGLGNYTSMRDGFIFHGHGGDGDGYLARLAYNRDTRLGYFVVINAFKNPALEKIRKIIEKHIIQGRNQPGPVSYLLNDDLIEQYTGTYQPATYRFPLNNNERGKGNRVKIISIKGKLFILNKKHKTELIPVNNHHFHYAGESVASSAFSYDDEGNLYFQDKNNNYIKTEN